MFSLRFRPLTGSAAVLAVLIGASCISAQGPEKVRFLTPDEVDIHGSWYAAGQGAPVVMILHEIGSDSRRREWTTLAAALQQAGYAVLTFDFRGHGQSTGVGQSFPAMNRGIKVQAGGTIDAKTFKRGYYPTLINDIAAAKAFLDIKNDAGACNSSSLILIGAGESATLGAVWLKSEWSRYRMDIGAFNRPMINFKEPFGMNVSAGIWLSMSHRIANGGSAKLLPPLLMKAAKLGNMPMVFLHNANDTNDVKLAKYCVKSLKTEKNPKHRFIGELGIANAGKLKGRQLLLAQGTTDGIVQWLGTLKKAAMFKTWVQQDFPKTKSVWWLGRSVPATLGLGQKTFQMMNYSTFVNSR